jgi:hypothetical protein
LMLRCSKKLHKGIEWSGLRFTSYLLYFFWSFFTWRKNIYIC